MIDWLTNEILVAYAVGFITPVVLFIAYSVIVPVREDEPE